MQYLAIFLASLFLECLSTLWTRAVSHDRYWQSVGLSFLHDVLSWGILIMALSTDWSLCPFAILGNTLGTAIAMRPHKGIGV